MVNSEDKPVPNWWYHPEGVAQYLDDERKEIILEVAEYLEEHYSQYGRGILYLRQLAGDVALPRSPPPQIQFLLTNPVGIQRGAVVLANAQVHTVHTMQVRFHRYH